MLGVILVFPQEILENSLSLEFYKWKILKSISSEDASILNSYYVQYSKQAHKILASSDKKKLLLFSFHNKVKRNSDFKSFFWENMNDSPHILLQIGALYFIHFNEYILIKKHVFWYLPPCNDFTVSNILKWANRREPDECTSNFNIKIITEQSLLSW